MENLEPQYLLLSTLVTTLTAGIFLTVIADYFKIPSIGLLLIGGVILGPEVLNIVRPQILGHGLQLIVSIAVCIVIFEGALSLNFKILKSSFHVIQGLCSTGVLITWLSTAFLVYWFFSFSIGFSLLAGSLVIVTGPTVIKPLLQRVKVRQQVHHILNWEGVLIDPIGVFIALLCLEWIAHSGDFWDHIHSLLLRICIGGTIGTAGSYLIIFFFKKKWVSKSLKNIFVLGVGISLYGIADLISSESGILTVVIMGSILSYKMRHEFKNIEKFHQEIVRLIIGFLFIILAANLDLAGFLGLGWEGLMVILAVLFVIRPLNVFSSTIKSGLSFREKLFLSWINPRGIVAAFMASLFSLILAKVYPQDSWFLESFTFAIVIVSVLLQGSFSGIVAHLLSVQEASRDEWLIVGSNVLSYGIAAFLENQGKKVIILDRQINYELYTEKDSFQIITDDILALEPMDDPRFDKVGHIITATTNKELNKSVCHIWAEELLPAQYTFYLTVQSEDTKSDAIILPGESLQEIDNGMLEGYWGWTVDNQADDKDVYPILGQEQSKIKMYQGDANQNADHILYLAKYKLPLHKYLLPELVVANMDIKEILTFLIHAAEIAAQALQLKNVNDIQNTLIKSEPTRASYIGNGVAMPQLISAEIHEPICAVFQLPKGMEYVPNSGLYVQLVFLTIAPRYSKSVVEHLKKEIKSKLNDVTFREALLAAKDSEDLFFKLFH